MNAYKVINFFIAMVWLINGLYCKILNQVPRHEAIVGEILNTDYSHILILIIGILEVFMAFWILSLYKSRINAMLQMIIIGSMNVIEFLMVPDLLLWGRFNAIFALMLIFLVGYNEFFLKQKYRT